MTSSPIIQFVWWRERGNEGGYPHRKGTGYSYSEMKTSKLLKLNRKPETGYGRVPLSAFRIEFLPLLMDVSYRRRARIDKIAYLRIIL